MQQMMIRSLPGCVLILAAAGVRAVFLHKVSKNTFLGLWAIALCRLFLPLQVSAPCSIYTMLGRAAGQIPQIQPQVFARQTGGDTAMLETVIREPLVDISPLLCIWFAGVLLCAGFLLVTHGKRCIEYSASLPVQDGNMQAWQRMNRIRRSIQIRKSDQIDAPLTYGVWRPVILLPTRMDFENFERLKYVLTHEMMHIRRFDTLFKWILAGALCIAWLNPCMWLLYVLANRDIELACDEAVLRVLGQSGRSAYALTLIGMAERRCTHTPFCTGFCKNALEERIQAMLKMKKTSIFSIMLSLTLVTGTMAVLATSPVATEQTEAISDTDAEVARQEPTQDELLKEYGSYGVSFDHAGKMLFHGDLVRYFWDGAKLDAEGNTSAVHYEYLNEEGIVDVHTVRGRIDNGDGSFDPFGELTGIIADSAQEFAQRDLAALQDGSMMAVTADSTGDTPQSQGKTFAQYEAYGIKYQEDHGRRNVYLHGQLIRSFIDVRKDSVFTFESTDGGNQRAYTVYDEQGNCIGIWQETLKNQ